MKEKFTQELKDIISQSVSWAKLEVEYAKFTIAEKVTILLSGFVIGAVCLLLGVAMLLMLAFCIVELFKMIMAPSLAYLCVAGIIALMILLIYLLRKPLLLNPIAKFITRLFFHSSKNSSYEQ